MLGFVNEGRTHFLIYIAALTVYNVHINLFENKTSFQYLYGHIKSDNYIKSCRIMNDGK